MKDEEMAINWIRSQGWSEENLPCDELLQMETAYLAGLKAGRPKWHKVADGDLPLMMEDEREISNNVWIHITNWGTEVGHYDYRKKAWIVRCMLVNLDVIAWCDIPEYTDE